MRYGKKTEPHPSKLPKLSDKEIIALERDMRIQSAAWGLIIVPPEPPAPPTPEKTSWVNGKPPGIQKIASTIKKAARKIGKSLRRRGKKKSFAPD